MQAQATSHTHPWRRPRAAALAAALLLLAASAGLALRAGHAEGAPGNNVVFILTDDQAASELASMPNTSSLIGGHGVTFSRAYSPYPLCCPSRASILTGEYMHNHQVRGNSGPFGGWTAFQPHESETIATAMQDEGYYTVHLGKYVNGYAIGPPDPLPVPPGWSEWYGKISEPDLYQNFSLIEQEFPGDDAELVFYGDQEDDYQSDVLGAKAVDFIDTASGPESPFMLNVWFNAPHSPYEPAPRHLFDLAGAALPRLQAFDEKDISDKPKWLRKQARKRLPKRLKGEIAAERRRRLEMMISVDEAVAEIVSELEDEGILDDTYVIFASDNGFFRGEHRLVSGKYLAYEPSARVPLMIRGPGIPEGARSEELVSAIDISQTVLEIASGEEDPGADGRSFLPYALDPSLRSTRPLLLEADTGPGRGNAGFDPQNASASRARAAKLRLRGSPGVNNLDQEYMGAGTSVANGNFAPAYRAIRSDRYLYVLYANGQSELYDMLADPAQLRSLHADPRYRFVRSLLFDELVGLANCDADACRAEAGPDPAPLPKQKPKKRRR